MNENEKLRRQVDDMRKDLEEAHHMIAKTTYKLGYLAAALGIAPDQTHLEMKAQVSTLAILPKKELAELRELAKRAV